MSWELPPREKTRQIKKAGVKRFQQALADGSYVRKADYGRQWVYRNEEALWKNMEHLRKDLNIDELRVYSEDIFNDSRVMEIDPYKGDPIFVQDSCRSGACAYPYRRLMRFGTLKDNFTMYHEIAHILTPADKHGRKFCAVYVQLIEWFMGEEVAQALARNLNV
jgi:hypothetical protein